MPHIEILHILAINFNQIGTQEANEVSKCNTNTSNKEGLIGEQLYTNPRQEANRPERCMSDTNNMSIAIPPRTIITSNTQHECHL